MRLSYERDVGRQRNAHQRQGLGQEDGNLVALDHFSLDVREGEILGLLGPNGSGKTTAINCILSLLRYDKGTVEIFGRPMAPDAYESKRDIGVVPQNVAVFNELTVEENIDYFCGMYVEDRAVRRGLVQEAVEFVGLADFRRFYPRKLSGARCAGSTSRAASRTSRSSSSWMSRRWVSTRRAGTACSRGSGS